MADYRIAVLDIGKTNKKLFVFDSQLRCLNPDERGAVFEQVESGGLLCDDMAAIHDWMMRGLSQAAERFANIRCISISTHGATLALLGRRRDGQYKGDGGLVFPIVSYEQDIGPDEEAVFFRDMGMSPEEMQRCTGTARFGWLLNHGKQVHWLKRRFPERFAEVTDILMFPQYLGYLLTGEKGIEPTYPGCHGYLLDIDGAHYSIVAERLGIVDLLPPLPLRPTWEPLGTLKEDLARETGLPADCLVTVGVHDSNAALVPYFVKGLEDFVVQDSGTWIVTMAPTGEAAFADEELGREVFFNRSIYGGPIKTTIFRGGAEFEFYRDRVMGGRPHPEGVDLDLLRDVLEGCEAFCLPTVERGTGLFPDSVARLEGVDVMFRDAATAWCVIDLGLAVQGSRAIEMAAGGTLGEIYIEGNVGRSNPVYRSVISTLFPAARVSFGSMGGAPYGSAILGAAAVEGTRPEALADRCRMTVQEVPKLDLDPHLLRRYVQAFLARLR